MKNKDNMILFHILKYIEQIECTLAEFDNDYSIFLTSNTCKNAISLCLLQIGELVGRLSDEFITAHNSVQWRNIKAFRNIVAHQYEKLNLDMVWEIATENIAELKKYIQPLL